MNIRISTRLFVALAAMGILVAGVTVLASRYSFNRGFVGYVNNQSVEQLSALVPRFETAYRTYGNWDFLYKDHHLWFKYVQPSYVYRVGPPPHTIIKPPTVILTGLFNRIALLDANLKVIDGDPEVTLKSPRVPINVDGRAVGWLAVAPFQSVTGPADLRFQHAQYLSMWVIAAGAMLIAALAAWLLSRTLAAPLGRIAAAMHRLAAGEYRQRLKVTSQDEIGQLLADFNDLASGLQRHEEARRIFIADVSHELRTPLAVLRGLTEALEDGVRKPTADTMLSLKTEVLTLNKLVDDLYDLSLSDRGALAYRKCPITVNETLRLTVDAFTDRLAERRLKIDSRILAADVVVEADETRLQQVFNNILENSLRYTDPGGTVVVRLTLEQSQAIVDFEDTAPGVPDASIGRLFERFFRADPSRSRATGGAGLGLSICKNIVEAHDGSISIHPSPLGGLWVRVKLPASRRHHLQQEAGEALSSSVA